ncbi:MAG: cobalamin-dependent protein [Desulfovermiculus sp.]
MDEKLRDELADLPQLSEQSVTAYKENLAALVEKVNKIMSSRADLKLLIGDNPLQMMFENHKNHGLFMSNVFSLHKYELLAHTVPWVYRAYHSHGFSYAYFPAHLQAWRTALQETLSNAEAQPLIQVYDWMLSRHEEFIAWSQDTQSTPSEPSEPWNEVYQEFVQALVQGDKNRVMHLGQSSVPSSQDLVHFYLQVVQPAMYTVGEMWEKGEISVAKEHLASALVNRLMSSQYVELMRPGEGQRGRAVVSATVNEFHEIGATMVANSLELDGWEVEYLGSNMPKEDLLDFVFAYQPNVLALSAAIPFNLESMRKVIQSITNWPAEKRPKVMVGGLAFQGVPDLAKQLGADGYARDCSQAVQLAKTWLEQQAQ